MKLTHVVTANAISFPPLNPAARKNATRRLDESLRGVRAIAPDMGAYMNEVCSPTPTCPIS